MSNSDYRLDKQIWRVCEVEILDRQTGKIQRMPKSLVSKHYRDLWSVYEITDTDCYVFQYEGRLMQGTSILTRTMMRFADTIEKAETFYKDDLARLPEIIQKYDEEKQDALDFKEFLKKINRFEIEDLWMKPIYFLQATWPYILFGLLLYYLYESGKN
jgi:hypothetical protein